MKAESERTIILFGDSITAGYTAEGIGDSLTKRVQHAFPDYQVINAGIPGDNTRGALARVEAHVLKYNPTYVSLFFGANDATVDNDLTLAEFRTNLTELIQRIGPQRVMVLGTPYARQSLLKAIHPISALQAYSAAAEVVATKAKVTFIELLATMMAVDPDGHYLQEDGLHFSEVGYDFLGAQLVAALSEKISRKE